MTGAVAGLLCFAACTWLKMKLRYDDSLDVFGVHGVAGLWGVLATGLFFQVAANPNVKALNAPLYEQIVSGAHHPVSGQLIGIGIAVAVAAVGTLVCLGLTRLVVPLRVTADEEQEGLDVTQHGEEGYHGMT